MKLRVKRIGMSVGLGDGSYYLLDRPIIEVDDRIGERLLHSQEVELIEEKAVVASDIKPDKPTEKAKKKE